MTVEERPRRTRIVATLGPACDEVETLTNMIQSGMNVARLNLSHGNFEEHGARVECIREAATAAGSRVAIMIDTRGIEIRTGLLLNNYVDLSRGAGFAHRCVGRAAHQPRVALMHGDSFALGINEAVYSRNHHL